MASGLSSGQEEEEIPTCLLLPSPPAATAPPRHNYKHRLQSVEWPLPIGGPGLASASAFSACTPGWPTPSEASALARCPGPILLLGAALSIYKSPGKFRKKKIKPLVGLSHEVRRVPWNRSLNLSGFRCLPQWTQA